MKHLFVGPTDFARRIAANSWESVFAQDYVFRGGLPSISHATKCGFFTTANLIHIPVIYSSIGKYHGPH
jgi:hypothetical protein